MKKCVLFRKLLSNTQCYPHPTPEERESEKQDLTELLTSQHARTFLSGDYKFLFTFKGHITK